MAGADLLVGLSAMSPRRMLDELVVRSLRQRSRGEPGIEVTILLANGHPIVGVLLSVADGTALLHTGGRAESPMVAHVRIDSIAAVCTTLQPAPEVKRVVPGKLELARGWAVAVTPLTIAWPALAVTVTADSDDDRAAAGEHLGALEIVLRELVADPIGREACAALRGIELTVAEAGTIVRTDGVLVIAVPRSVDHGWSTAKLRTALEAAL
jgi:hypothetical protein